MATDNEINTVSQQALYNKGVVIVAIHNVEKLID